MLVTQEFLQRLQLHVRPEGVVAGNKLLLVSLTLDFALFDQAVSEAGFTHRHEALPISFFGHSSSS